MISSCISFCEILAIIAILYQLKKLIKEKEEESNELYGQSETDETLALKQGLKKLRVIIRIFFFIQACNFIYKLTLYLINRNVDLGK